MPNTARGAFPFPLPADTPDVPRDISALANRIAAVGVVFQQGLAAARPAANSQGGAGFFYFATDSTVVSYSDGAAWHEVDPAASQDFLDAPGRTRREAVVDLASGAVTRVDSATVAVAAGTAWINGDGVAGVGNGRYRLSWVATNIAIPAAVNSRVDRIVARAQGAWGVNTVIERIAGADGVGNNLVNLTGAGAVPNGAILLANVLASPAVTDAANIDDQRRVSREGGIEDWHTIGAAGEQPFMNGFGVYGGGLSVPAYCIDADNVVRLKGHFSNAGSALNSEAAGTIFNLPVGYRPTLPNGLTMNANNAWGLLRILPNGNVFVIVGNTSFGSLDGITFRAGDPVDF